MALFNDDFSGANDTLLTGRTGWATSGAGGNTIYLDGTGAIKDIGTEGSTVAANDTGASAHYFEAVIGQGFVDSANDIYLAAGHVLTARYSGILLRYTHGTTTLGVLRETSSLSGTLAALSNLTQSLAAGDTLRVEWNYPTRGLVVKHNGSTIYSATESGTEIDKLDGTATAVATQYGAHTTRTDVVRSWQSNTLGDATAPTLTSPTGTSTGATTASGTVTTDEANGTLYRMASTNATETAAVVVAAALSQTVTATGVQNVTFTGLTASTTYYAHYVHDDAATNRSARVSSASFTTATPDTTAPTLTGSLTATSKTSTTVALSCPTGSDNVAVTGYEWSSENGATWPGQTAGTTYTFTGLTALTSYTFRVRAKDAAGNGSTPALTLTTSTYRAGALGSTILLTTGPVDGNPAGILYNDVQAGDEAKWFSFVITTPPATGTLVIDPDGTFTFTGPNAETMYYQLEVDGANVGSPVLVELFSGSFFRPLGDVTTTGWTSTETTLYAAINELAADDADYITSPDVAGTPGSYTFDLPSMAAGTYTRRMRMKKTGATGEARLVFLDSGSASVGATAWIALTASWATYEASVTLTGTAVRGRIEVRA